MKFCFEERPEHFGALFGYCDHQVHKLMGKLLKRYDVSPMQCRTLMYLHGTDGQVNDRLERGFSQEEKAVFTDFLLRAARNLADEEETEC